jgi:ArsR family transcriptional regulator
MRAALTFRIASDTIACMSVSSSVRSRAGTRARRDPAGAMTLDARRIERIRRALEDHAQVGRLSRTFRALGDPTRSKMVYALSLEELCVSELAEALGASLSAVSHQLRILRDLEIVRVRRAGKAQVYALNERAFGFCAPRFCQAWKQTLESETLVRPGPPSPRSRRPGP